MTNTLKIIKSRRSTRSFKPQQISRPHLEQILEAGSWAPSGKNFQGWHFCALHNSALVKDLAAAVRSALFLPANYCFYGAPTLIIVSYLRDHEHAWLDAGAAVENMLLTAESLGLGSCWINQLRNCCDNKDVRAMLTRLGVPPEHMVVACVALGEIDQRTPAKPRNPGVFNIVE